MKLVDLKTGLRQGLSRRQAIHYGKPQKRFADDMTFSQAAEKFRDTGDLYRYMHHYFHNTAPPAVREHRSWFSRERRGFGEDAFHAMWFMLLREFRPRNCLEIGIYRGQTISLWGMVAGQIGFDCELHGISPFSSAGDQASRYSDEVDYLADTLLSFRKFGVGGPHLLKAYSTDEIAMDYIRSRKWDLIYIDGNHDYDVVLADYEICRDNLAPGGLLVMDDSSLYTSYRPPLFSFAGHIGPSRVFRDFAAKELNPLATVGHNNILLKRNS